MTAYVLYGHRESGHSYKAALALRLLGLAFEFRNVDLSRPRAERRADWRAVALYGEVPVLVADGAPIRQSDAILLHLARTTGRLGGDDLDAAAGWLFWEANRIGISLPNLRHYGYLSTSTDVGAAAAADPGVIAWLRARLEADLTRLDQELSGKPFLLGAAVSVADLACAGYIFFAEQVDIDLADWPQVAVWRARIADLPGWAHPYDLLVES